MSAIPGSALDIKRRLAAGEPCPLCQGMWFTNGGTAHADGCLYAEYEHLRLRSIDEIARISKLLTACQARCDKAEHELRYTEHALDNATRKLRRGM